MDTAGDNRIPSGRKYILAALVLLLIAGAGIAYVGTRGSPLPEVAARPATAVDLTSQVVTLDLPALEPDVPQGPHRQTFQVSCTVCHSLRVPLSQPRLPEAKWKEVVHKMVAAYGAPMTPDQEKEIVAYLMTVRGKEQQAK